MIAAEKTGTALRQTLAQRPNSRQILITLFGKSQCDLTPDEYARYRRLAKLVSYYRRHERNKAQQRKDKSWKKLEILQVLGWDAACDECGYDQYIGALEFHHLDPTQKKGLVKTVEEARKCRLLCANCHRKIQAGMPCGRGGRPFGMLDPLLVPYMRLSGLTDTQIDRAVAGRPDNGLATSSKVITLSGEHEQT
jgi:5-methylcytosine-specific restriction endonuclease McrA